MAQGGISPECQAQYGALLEKNRMGTISQSEAIALDQLCEEADREMIRKAYAYILLKWRGYRLPALAELETRH